MGRTVIITDHELSILCDLTGGWGAKWNGDDKQPTLSRLITEGFVELAPEGSLIRYQNTVKAERLLGELCVGICES
jgi:hypothetical protein